jgi:hypothetical protein
MANNTDPYRALGLSIRSARFLGIGSFVIGVAVIVFWGLLNRMEQFRPHFIAIGIGLWLIPAACYFTSVGLMRKHLFGGLILAILAAAVHTIAPIIFIIMIFVVGPISVLPLAVLSLWFVTMVQVLVLLARAMPAIRMESQNRQHGFSPILKTDQ